MDTFLSVAKGRWAVRGSENLYVMYQYPIQCEAPKIPKLVYNSNNYGLWYL